MSGLVKVEREQIKKKLVAALGNHTQIAGAYLFGSALGNCRPDSDIDIGLITMPLYKVTEREFDIIEARILKELLPLDAHHFDLVFLTAKNYILSHKAINSGRLVYVRNMGAVTDFIETVSLRYRESYPRYRQALETIALGESE